MERRHAVFCFLALLFLLNSVHGLLSPKGVNYEVQALMSIKSYLVDPHSALYNWDDNAVDPCSWAMVTCSPDHFVIALGIPSHNLSGTHSPSIGNLTNRQSVQLMASILQVITCRAAVCWALGEPLKVEEIQVDPPKATEVRVKMLCASLCHTDIISIQGFPHARFPQVPGHQGIGVIESIGEKVRNLKEGDIVIPTYMGECQECENCLSSNTDFCSKCLVSVSGLMANNTSRMSVKGHKLYHIFNCATWSEYMVVDENYVVKVDPTIDLGHAASFISCTFSIGYGAAWKQAKVTSGSTVAVFGLSAIGLGVYYIYTYICNKLIRANDPIICHTLHFFEWQNY